MSQVCRTCLKIVESNSQVFSIEFKDPTLDNVHIKAKLEACVPEIVLNRVKNSVICHYCLKALNSAYEFKVKCLESEKKIFRFVTYSTMNCVDLNKFITKFTNDHYNQSNGNEEILQRQFLQSNQPFTPHPSLLSSSFNKPTKLLHPSHDFSGKITNPFQLPSKSLPIDPTSLHSSSMITQTKPTSNNWPNHVQSYEQTNISHIQLKTMHEVPSQHPMSLLHNNFSPSRSVVGINQTSSLGHSTHKELPLPKIQANDKLLSPVTISSSIPRSLHSSVSQSQYPSINLQLQSSPLRSLSYTSTSQARFSNIVAAECQQKYNLNQNFPPLPVPSTCQDGHKSGEASNISTRHDTAPDHLTQIKLSPPSAPLEKEPLPTLNHEVVSNAGQMENCSLSSPVDASNKSSSFELPLLNNFHPSQSRVTPITSPSFSFTPKMAPAARNFSTPENVELPVQPPVKPFIQVQPPDFHSPQNRKLEQQPPHLAAPSSKPLSVENYSFNAPLSQSQPLQSTAQINQTSSLPQYQFSSQLQSSSPFRLISSTFELPLQHQRRRSPLNAANQLLSASEFSPSLGISASAQFFPHPNVNHRSPLLQNQHSQVYSPFSHLRPPSSSQNLQFNQPSVQQTNFHLMQSQFQEPNHNPSFRPQVSQYNSSISVRSPYQNSQFLSNPFSMSQHYRSSIHPYPPVSSIQPSYQQTNRRSEQQYAMNHKYPLPNNAYAFSNHYRSSLSQPPRMALHYQNSLSQESLNRPEYQSPPRTTSPLHNNHTTSSLNSSSSSSSLHSSPSPSATSHYPAPPLFHPSTRPPMSLLRSCLSTFQPQQQSSHRLPIGSSPPPFPMFGTNQELNGIRMKVPNSFLYHFNNNNNKEASYLCTICRAGFATPEQLQEHATTHDNTSFKCNLCDFQTNLSEIYEEHQNVHKTSLEEQSDKTAMEVVETVYNCDQCEFTTTNKASFEDHRFKHEPVVYKCQICNFKSIHASSLRRHKKIHMNDKEFKCRRCDVMCETYQDLLTHMTESHTEQNSDVETEENEKQVDPYQVSIDDIQNIIEDESDLMDEGEQSDSVMENESEMVNDIDSYMITAADLEKILNEEKGDTDTEMAEGKGDANVDGNEVKTIFNCRVCQQPFQFKYQLKKHMIIHSVTKQILECPMCEYRTTTKSHLQVHMNTHTGGTIYRCEQCDYCSVYWSNMEKHNRVHTGEKPYKCDYCDYSVTKMSRLRNHLELHAKQKLYKCKECSFEADSEENLLNHKVIHNYGNHFLQDEVDIAEAALPDCESTRDKLESSGNETGGEDNQLESSGNDNQLGCVGEDNRLDCGGEDIQLESSSDDNQLECTGEEKQLEHTGTLDILRLEDQRVTCESQINGELPENQPNEVVVCERDNHHAVPATITTEVGSSVTRLALIGDSQIATDENQISINKYGVNVVENNVSAELN